MQATTADAIEAIRQDWGERLLILGHHYQRSDVLRHVDLRGDSLELARGAAAHRHAERIVFCGVRFMAETADILTRADQAVYMPETTALCPMAEMATAEQLEAAWQRLQSTGGRWAPVVYVNSTAEVKAFCGRKGGSACTSGNARAVLTHFLEQGQRVLFAPDEHLADNTLHDMGLPDNAFAVYDPALPNGGLCDADLASVRLVAWKGFCHVHTAFTPAQVARVRASLPEARIIVHPESPREVVRAVDAHGSTAEIIRYVAAAPDGATIVIGTEHHLVARLAAEQAGRVKIFALCPSSCPNMAKTHVAALYELLQNWPDSRRVRVPAAIAGDARLALERMLAL